MLIRKEPVQMIEESKRLFQKLLSFKKNEPVEKVKYAC